VSRLAGVAPNHERRRLSLAERARMDRYEVKIDELTVDHIVYSMSRQIENTFQSFYTVAEDLIGEEAALKLAYEIGRRYGGLGYSKLLEVHGRGNDGSPEMMALYQDLVHAIRGSKHAEALFAEHDGARAASCAARRASASARAARRTASTPRRSSRAASPATRRPTGTSCAST
jgi:hypothetical protein